MKLQISRDTPSRLLITQFTIFPWLSIETLQHSSGLKSEHSQITSSGMLTLTCGDLNCHPIQSPAIQHSAILNYFTYYTFLMLGLPLTIVNLLSVSIVRQFDIFLKFWLLLQLTIVPLFWVQSSCSVMYFYLLFQAWTAHFYYNSVTEMELSECHLLRVSIRASKWTPVQNKITEIGWFWWFKDGLLELKFHGESVGDGFKVPPWFPGSVNRNWKICTLIWG